MCKNFQQESTGTRSLQPIFLDKGHSRRLIGDNPCVLPAPLSPDFTESPVGWSGVCRAFAINKIVYNHCFSALLYGTRGDGSAKRGAWRQLYEWAD